MKSNTLVLAFSACAALAPLAVAQVPPPVDLGTLGGSSSIAYGIGTIGTSDTTVGGANVFTDVYQHATYTNPEGYLEDLESLIGVYGNSYAGGISAKGAITGTSDQIIDSEGDIASHAFYFTNWRTGLVDIGTNGGTIALGNATQLGAVVGASTVANDVAYVGFFWSPKKGMVNLNTLAGDGGLDGYNSYVYGMNTKGAAVGSSDYVDGSTHAVAWALKTYDITDLETLGGSYAQANAVNDSNVVTGFSSLVGDSQIDAFYSVGSTIVDLGNLGGSYAAGSAINDSGVIVGSSNITGDTDVHAFVWTPVGGATNGVIVDLNSYLPEGSPFIELNAANGIAADGTIVGVGTALDGQSHAFVWQTGLLPTAGAPIAKVGPK